MRATARFWLLAMLLTAATPALAQTPQPASPPSGPRFPPAEREPVPGQVQERLRERGLSTQEFTPQQDQTVDQIFKDLTGQSPTGQPPPAQGQAPRR